MSDRIAGATGDCSTCKHWKCKGSKFRGQTIPGGYGKCIRPQGHCNPEKPKVKA